MKRKVVAGLIIAVIVIVIAGVASFIYLSHHYHAPSKVVSKVSKPTRKTTKTVVTVCNVTWPHVTVRYAKLFKIEYTGSYYLIVKDAANHTFILVPRGCPSPKNVHGIVIYVPIRRAVYLSTTEVALLYRVAKAMHHLSLLKTVVGVSFKGPWWIPYMSQLLKNGTTTYVGSNWALDIEKVVELKPEIVFMYTGFSSMLRLMKKLEEAGLKVAVDNEWLENSYLARFEWIKFIAAFYGPKALATAARIFNNTVYIRNELIKEFRGVYKGKNVTFLWFFASPRWGIWVPKRDAYPIKFLEKLGAVYVLAPYVQPGGGSERISKELLVKVADKAQFIVIAGYPPYITSIDQVAKIVGSWFLNLPAVKNHRVYFYTPSYWQLGYAYTDTVLEDLATLVHPDAVWYVPILHGHVRVFFHHLWRANETMKLEFCRGFRVVYHGFYKLVTDYANNTWLVVPWDLVDMVPKSVFREVKGVIKMPIHRVAAGLCGAARLIGLGFSNLIVAVTGYTYSAWPLSIQKLIREGKLVKLGCVYSGFNFEALEKVHPDVYIGGAGLLYKPQVLYKIINVLHIPTIVIDDSKEHNVFALVEVSKLVAALLDYEELAQELLQKNIHEIKMLEEKLRGVERPTIVYVFYYNGRFGIANPEEPRAQLLELAGARYALTGNRTGWTYMSIEQFIAKFKNVDWIFWSWPYLKSMSQLLKMIPELKVVRAVKLGHVIVVVRPDYFTVSKYDLYAVVKDLAAILHPQLFPGYRPVFFAVLK